MPQHCGHESRFVSHGQYFNRAMNRAEGERNKDLWRISSSLTNPNKEEAEASGPPKSSSSSRTQAKSVKWSVEWGGGGA